MGISIAGFGTLQSQQLLLRQEDKGNFCCKMQWQVCTQSLRLHLDDTKTYDIGIRSERVLSIFSVILMYGLSNLKQVVLTLVGRLLQLKLQDLTIR
jgi:hypothetical protein